MSWSSAVPWDSIISNNADKEVSTNGTVTTKKNISQEGINKIIYDILSSDKGLASLSSGENGSGGFNSATKGLMAQDLMVKLAGEIANITAETSNTTNNVVGEKKTSELFEAGGKLADGVGTIICTHMMERGLVSKKDWLIGNRYNQNLPDRMILGYQFWAEPIVDYLRAHPDSLTEKFWLWMVKGRYDYTNRGKINLAGLIGVKVLGPISHMIGFLLGVPNGRYA